MSVGETLAHARRDAGLSIAEVSIRTRIRRSVIEGIEHDDYSACGGDSSARGDIAVLARALGADSELLVQAYDASRQPGEWIDAATPRRPVTAAPSTERVRPPEPVTQPGALTRLEAAMHREAATPPEGFPPALKPGAGTAGEDTDTLPIPIGQPPEPVMAGEQPNLPTAGPPSGPLSADEPLPTTSGRPPYPARPARASGLARLGSADRRQVMWIAAGAALFAVAGLAGILYALSASGQARPQAQTPPSPGHSVSSPGPTRSASRAASRPVRALVPASIAAFGPGGTGGGDSPELARLALNGKAGGPWHSSWYTTPNFGNLQNGTGLLLDMGRTVTLRSAQIALGSRPGADLALRIGNSPTLASLRPVAHARGASGVVRLTTAPARGRYVLVWFTKLPPDQTGTYQVFVYNIKLRGYP